MARLFLVRRRDHMHEPSWMFRDRRADFPYWWASDRRPDHHQPSRQPKGFG